MDFPIPSLVLLGLGLLLALAGGIIVIVSAFRESVGWGLVVLFAPLGNIVFTCVHWSQARVGFLVNIAGALLFFGGVATIPALRDAIMKGTVVDGSFLRDKFAKEKPKPPEPDLNAQIAEKRKTVEELQGTFASLARELPPQYQQLEKRRVALKPNDAEALNKFKQDADEYQAKNLKYKEVQQTMIAAQAALDQLLDARSRAAAGGGGGGAIGSKPIVMYTTSHCPACKAAKEYMAQKGIKYQEIDVETSRDGMAAFQKLGGHGVPLILVGEKRMEGFNSQELEKMRL